MLESSGNLTDLGASTATRPPPGTLFREGEAAGGPVLPSGAAASRAEASDHDAASRDSTGREITRLLRRWHAGDARAASDLVPRVYQELRRLALIALDSERQGHTLQATALVHEVYLRLRRGSTPDWRDRVHFFAVAARLMRRILVDHARAAKAERRGGAAPRVSLEERDEPAVGPQLELLALDHALEALQELRPRQARVVDLRFFAGLTVPETAAVLGVSPQTVVLDTRLA
ncbi:MAG: ECF-type sigma factor, partial [Holophagales bacterium]|nr:ECF-type sigma factor [Holophagales bacterium]